MYLENKTLTVSEFCEKYRIHRTTYYRNEKKGRMPKSIKIGSQTRILAHDEEEWLDNQRIASASAGDPSMSRRRVRFLRSPLIGPELQNAIEVYNSYVPQHNANQLDWSKPIPSDRDKWSPIVAGFAKICTPIGTLHFGSSPILRS